MASFRPPPSFVAARHALTRFPNPSIFRIFDFSPRFEISKFESLARVDAHFKCILMIQDMIINGCTPALMEDLIFRRSVSKYRN